MTEQDEKEAVFLRDWNCWHRSRIEELKAPYGWLSQIGLYWFNDLNQYSVHVPGVPGTWQLTNNTVRFFRHSTDRDDVQNQTIRSTASHASVRKDSNDWQRLAVNNVIVVPSDRHEDALMLAYGDIHMSVIERDNRFGVRVRDPNAPTRRQFNDVPTFKPSRSWLIQASFEPLGQTVNETVPTKVEGISSTLQAQGHVRFTLNRHEYSLLSFDGGDDLFIVFTDETSGVQTYGSGRFLSAKLSNEGSKNGAQLVWLDFNRSENPPCAFSPYCTCPIAPSENHLPLAITAGEKDPHSAGTH